jgi:uncharacterized protein YceK
MRCGTLLLTVALGPLAGCGTFHNVTAPRVESSAYRAFGPDGCEPFGGVQRSVMAGSAPLMAGALGVPLAAVAVGIDAPLSLVGDVVTLPIVMVRRRNAAAEPAATPELVPTAPIPLNGLLLPDYPDGPRLSISNVALPTATD